MNAITPARGEIHPMITPDSSSDTHVPVVTAYRRTLRAEPDELTYHISNSE